MTSDSEGQKDVNIVALALSMSIVVITIAGAILLLKATCKTPFTVPEDERNGMGTIGRYGIPVINSML